MLQRDAQAVLDIPPRLLQPLAEVVITGRIDPAVVLRPGVEPRLVDGRREEFGQRTAGRLLPDGAAGEIDIGVYREAYAGQHEFLRQHLFAVQPHGFGQP